VARRGKARSWTRTTRPSSSRKTVSPAETFPELVVEADTFKPTEREFNEWIEALARFLLDDSNGCGGR
jgi:hypothetical protein